MLGSDDFEFDDDVFDETTLAALDEAESSYYSTKAATTTVHEHTPPDPPPAKRQKTFHPRPVSSSKITDLDDLPDISVQDDGTYGIGAPHSSKNLNVFQHSTPKRNPGFQRPQIHDTGTSGLASTSNLKDIHASSSTAARHHVGGSEQPPDALRQKFEELQNMNAQLQAQLLQATESVLSKEGEVSILRKTMEKTAHDHTNELSRMRMVREEAEAKQKQIQRQLKEEIEILKTQFAFKQQELQSSLHGPTVPGSARPKKLGNLVPSTPLAKTTTWEHIPGPSARPFETPRRNRYLPSQADNSKLANPRVARSPAAARKSAMLPGFENAFMPSSPVKGTQATSNKGKMRAVIPQEMDIFEQPGPQSPISNTEDLFGMDVDPAPQMVAEMTQPAKGGSSAVVPAPTKEVVIESIEPFDFNAELSRIISTHTTKQSNMLTLQLLVAVNVPESKEYVEACASVIRVLATKSDHPASFQLNVQTVADAFTRMLPVLISSRLILPLLCLLDLLAYLTIALPFVSASLLSRTPTDSETPLVMVHLKDIVSTFLAPALTTEHKCPLTLASIDLVEGLCWSLTEELTPRLSSVVTDPDIIPFLLDNSQPNVVLTKVVRLLCSLATHIPLNRAMLIAPDATRPTRVPLLERLSTYLVNRREGSDVEDVHKLILCFFGTLSSDAEALEVLAGSPMLIPSICTYIYNLALPLWEEDVRLSAHPELADNIVQSIRIALFLLHHLVFSPKSDVDLVAKLQQAPPRHLNGAIHTFIVCIGRLSYAEPPSWMTPQASQALERVVDLARELIEQVVDGPEGDAVWEVYHGEFRGVNMDEEEMEAQLLGTQASV